MRRILLRSRLVLGPYGGLVWSRTLKTWKTIGFTMCSLKSVEKALVLLCFRSKRLNNQWFYCKISVKMQTSEKTIGFTVKTCTKVNKPLVLQCFRSKMLKNHWFYCVFAQKCSKTIGFTLFSLKNVEKTVVLLCCR